MNFMEFVGTEITWVGVGWHGYYSINQAGDEFSVWYCHDHETSEFIENSPSLIGAKIIARDYEQSRKICIRLSP